MSAGGAFDAVEARGLTKVYGRQRALAGVDLTLRAGEAMALLGPNGAGKSTLVGILATLVSPTAGKVRYGGSEAGDDELRGAIGVIAHESLCYGDLTGHENLVFFARLYGVRDARAVAERCSSASGCAMPPAARRAPTRAACCSASRWRARSCTSRGSCSPTSRSPGSTAPASRC